jgi:hypothetical protein
LCISRRSIEVLIDSRKRVEIRYREEKEEDNDDDDADAKLLELIWSC